MCFVSFTNAQKIKNDTIQLNETILYDKSKFRLKRVGSDTKTKTVQVGLNSDINFKNDSLPKYIKEIAIPISASNKEFTFQRINFNFSNSLQVDSVIVKVDLLSDLDNRPDKSILENPFNIVVKKENQSNNIFIYDLRDYNIKHKGNFYIKVELLSKLEKPIYLSAALLAKCLYKTKDSKEWHKTPLGITPAINADILIKR